MSRTFLGLEEIIKMRQRESSVYIYRFIAECARRLLLLYAVGVFAFEMRFIIARERETIRAGTCYIIYL